MPANPTIMSESVDDDVVRRVAKAIFADDEQWDKFPPSYQEPFLEHARRALTAIGNTVQEQGWRDIADAPKDGTRLLLWNSKYRGYSVTGSYRNFALTHRDWRTDSGAQVNATHFRPLPDPPVEGGGG